MPKPLRSLSRWRENSALPKPAVRIGDIALFSALLVALDLPVAWRRRLRRSFGLDAVMNANLDRLSAPRGQEDTRLDPEIRAAADRHDRERLVALLGERLAAHGHSEGAGRGSAEIAERFLDQRALAEGHIEAEQLAVLRDYLALELDLAAAVDALDDFARARGFAFGEALGFFGARTKAIAEVTRISDARFAAGFGRPLDYYTGLVFEVGGGGGHSAAHRRRALRPADGNARLVRAHTGSRLCGAARSGAGSGAMSALVLALPSKGRLKEQAEAMLAAAGLAVETPTGSRNYRGRLAGMADVEVAFLSASEIAQEVALGSVHLGITGEDLVREGVADAAVRVSLLGPLGFGHADVVVAVPEAWIDVWTMEDLDDVAASFRARHGRRMRIATKYWNLTQSFFASHGIALYRDRGKPRRHGRHAGGRHCRRHRRHHHDRVDARGEPPESAGGWHHSPLRGEPRPLADGGLADRGERGRRGAGRCAGRSGDAGRSGPDGVLASVPADAGLASRHGHDVARERSYAYQFGVRGCRSNAQAPGPNAARTRKPPAIAMFFWK